MQTLKRIGISIVGCGIFMATSNRAQAQVAVSIGPPPVCPYGYYEAPPYNCAPDGYYGPEWFVGGVFIGAGPWFHGPAHFYGHHNFDYRKGYHGPTPARGEHPMAQRREFHGEAMHDPHGHEAPRGHTSPGGDVDPLGWQISAANRGIGQDLFRSEAKFGSDHSNVQTFVFQQTDMGDSRRRAKE